MASRIAMRKEFVGLRDLLAVSAHEAGRCHRVPHQGKVAARQIAQALVLHQRGPEHFQTMGKREGGAMAASARPRASAERAPSEGLP